MVEGQRPAAVPGIGDDGPPGVVGAPGAARRPGQEDRRDGVEARVAGGVRIGPELAEELDVERGLLAGLADGGRFERLAVIDEASRQGPARRGIAALDENDAPPPPPGHDLDDDVDGRERVAVLAAGHGGPSAAIVGARSRPCQWTRPAGQRHPFRARAALSSSFGDDRGPAGLDLQAGVLA